MSRNDAPDDSARVRKRRRGDKSLIAGVLLVVIGAMFLVDQLGWFRFSEIWPVILIGLGLVMVIRYFTSVRRSQ